jgi:16S rRNA (adenine1518-N6/adenine1519-N6)-dimethyltransferase
MHVARKRFGQHFLHDPGVIQRIVAAIDPRPDERLVEIGPGLGAITLPLLARVPQLHAIEIDRDAIRHLRTVTKEGSALHLHEADALEFDLATLDDGRRLRIVGNLPYNISTPLLFRLIAQREHIRDMHFMLQKEVVDRMAAGPGSKVYGRLSVMLQAYCQVIA